MKPVLAMLAVLSVMLLAGCAAPAVSLHPLYLDKEKHATEAGIEGAWLSGGRNYSDTDRWDVRQVTDGCYEANVEKLKPEAGKPKEPETYRLCLLRLQEKLFADATLSTKNFGDTTVQAGDIGGGMVKGHILGWIWLDKDMLLAARLNSQWVEKNMPESFRAMQGKLAVITVEPAELRKFLVEHADEKPVWDYEYFCRPGVDCEARANADQLRRFPDDKEVLDNAALFYAMRSDFDRATALLHHAIAIDPQDASLHSSLALALVPAGDFNAVRNELAQAQKLDKENGPEVYEFYKGGAYFLEGNFQEASRIFAGQIAAQKAAGKPASVQVLLFNYFSLARSGQRKQAEAFLAKEIAEFVGPQHDQLLLLQATGRVTYPQGTPVSDDISSDDLLLYAESYLVRGDISAARTMLKGITLKSDLDMIDYLAAKIELKRMADGR